MDIKSVLQVLRWSFWLVCGWKEACTTQVFGLSSKSSVILPNFLRNLVMLVLVSFWFVESNSALQVLRWSFWLVCGWKKLALSSFACLLIRCDLFIVLKKLW